MLRNFRQVFKGNQAPMAVIMMVVLLGMVAYLAPSHGNPDAPDNVIARVYGRDINKRELDQAVEQIARQRLGKGANLEAMQPMLINQALDQLVQGKLVEELAERHGIVVTDSEIKSALESWLRQRGFVGEDNQLMPTTQINDDLRERGSSLKQLEQEITMDLSTRKLLQQAAYQVPVDAQWVDQENRVRNEKVSFEAATLTPDPGPVADPGVPRLEAFLKASGARFQTGPRRVIAFVNLTPAAMGLAPVDDAAVKAAYDAHHGQYTELKASHILFKASTDTEVQEAIKKAQEVRAKLVAGADFGQAAQSLSQDPGSKDKQGDLGWFQSGQMVKPFEQAALALKVGEISEPVRTSFGIHLIRLDGRREKPLDQVKDQLRAQLTREHFTAKAKDQLAQLAKRVSDRGDLGPAARKLNLKVQTSQAFAQEPMATVEGLPGSQNLVAEAFRLDVGQVSKVLPVLDGFVLFRVQEERPVAVPPLAEIRAKVLDAWKLEEARRTAMAKAKDLVKAGDLGAMGATAAQDSVAIASLGELGRHPAIRRALLDTAVGQLTPLLWTPEGKLWVARIKARTPAEALTFATRKTLVEQIQNEAAQKILMAEATTLERAGNLHPGFSSFYGRLNGIWRNKEALGLATDNSPADFGGSDEE